MKFLALALALVSFSVRAQSLTAQSFQELMQVVKSSTFTYKETGKIFGYVSTHSCMYVSEEVVIFKNYCFPVREYPAKGYLIISKKFGSVQLYQEQLPERLMRSITISQFPETLQDYLPEIFPQGTLKTYSAMIEKMYHNYFPACWSTSFSQYNEVNEAGCTVDTENVSGFEAWGEETQTIVNDLDAWTSLLKTIEKKLPKHTQR